MTAADRFSVVRGIGELTGASDAAVRSLVAFFDEVVVPAGVVLARGGELGHEFWVVADGTVEVCRRGRPTLLRRGESFGWAAMRDRGVHDATAVTVSPARLLVMGHAQFRTVEGVVAATEPGDSARFRHFARIPHAFSARFGQLARIRRPAVR